MPVNTILGLFAKSPITPLKRHIERVHACCDMLVPFIEATYAENWALAKTLHQDISGLEREADTLKREIRLKLPRGLFLPVDRTDFLGLLREQDKIANKAKDISGNILGRELKIPAEMQTDFITYLKRCIDAAAQTKGLIQEFDSLLEAGFKGREVELVEEMINQLDAIEDDTDSLQIQLRRQLHQIEDAYNPVDVIFLYKMLEWTGDLADQALRVGSRLELMLARS